MDFSYIKRILWKLKWLILGLPILCALITFFLIQKKPKQFNSKAQLATGITDQERVTIDDNDNNWNVISNRFSNFLAFIESKEIVNMISYKLLLHDLKSDKPFRRVGRDKLENQGFSEAELAKILPILQSKFDSLILLDLNNDTDKKLNQLIKLYGYDQKSISKMVSISRVMSSDFVKIETKSDNPQLSCYLANEYCTELIRFNFVTETRRFGNSLSFFGDLLKQKKAILDSKMDTLRRFKENSNVVNFNIQSETKLNQIAALEENRNEELKKISSLQSAINQIKIKIGSAGAAAGEEVFQNQSVIILQDKLQKLTQRFYNGNTGNKRLNDSIQNYRAELENKIYLLSKNGGGNFEATSKQELVTKKLNYEIELSMAQSNYGIIQGLLANLKASMTNIVADEGQIAALELQISAAKDEFINIETKYNQARNISLNRGGNLRQIEKAQPNEQPEPTHILLFTLISAILSGGLVVGGGIAYSFLDRRIRNAERFEDFTGIKSIGIIHKIDQKDLDLKKLIDILQKDNRDVILEQELRSLRYELIKDRSRSILFTSLEEGQGKSLVIFSLAYSLSKNGSKILIIDTNFKNNALSILFENFLFQNYMEQLDEGHLLNAENISAEDPKSFPSKVLYSGGDFIKKTGFENIDIIGSSNSKKSPFEIFNDKDFKHLIQVLSEKYDYVLLEGSALNKYTDSKELMEFTEKVVLVAKADYTITEADKVSLKFLNSQGLKLIGGIVNSVEENNV